MSKFDELVLKKQREFIENSDSLSIELVGDTWSDDHIMCATFNVNGHKVDWDWCGGDIIGAAKYCTQSPLAMDHVIAQLLDKIENVVDIAVDSWEDEMDTSEKKWCKVFNISHEEIMEVVNDM